MDRNVIGNRWLKPGSTGVQGLACLLVLVVAGFAGSTLAYADDLGKAVDTIFASIDRNAAPGCSVGVIKDGRLIHKAGYGLANLELGVALDSNNVHRMGSVSKQFTAMAVLLLVEEGKVDLQADIHEYLPALRDYGHKVSVNAMLGHFGGMADYDFISGAMSGESPVDVDVDVEGGLNIKSAAGGPFRIGNEDYLSISEFYDVVKKVPLRHPPATKFEYSNLAYFLLSMLVEEVSGESLRHYADRRIFKPLGMTRTFFSDVPTELVRHRAYGYKPGEHGGYVNDMTNLFWVGDGGLHTTIDDLLKWDQNFYHPAVGRDPAQLVALMNTPNSQYRDEGELYANGQFVGEFRSRQSFRHSGSWLGVSTHYQRFPSDAFSTIVLCNDASQDAATFAKEIAGAYFKVD